MWVEFVVASLLCSKGFSPSTKINSSKFQFDLETVDEEPRRGSAFAKFVIIIIIIIVVIIIIIIIVVIVIVIIIKCFFFEDCVEPSESVI